MKVIKKVLIMAMFILVSVNIFAVPAFNKTMTQKQSNGKEITYNLFGDEFISWARTTDEYTLLYNNRGDLVYAVLDNNRNLVASNVVASNVNQRDAKEIAFLSTIQRQYVYSKSQLSNIKQKRQQRFSRNNNSIDYAPTTGRPKFLVILVNFSDLTMNSSNATTFHNQISDSAYTTNNSTGSVKDYFYDNSLGQLNAQFDVYGPYTLPHTQSYYGAQTSTGDNDTLPQMMAYDAVHLADSIGNVNFANYDNDNDGYVDMVHIIYAGRGEHNGGGTNAIWAHSWVFPSGTTLDGVNFYSYSCSCELNYSSTCDGIGTICHEMGHVLGLPDFYDTDYEEKWRTIYSPSIMGSYGKRKL